MQYQLSDVSINDAEALVRQCQFPAMRQDPLRKIMFPNLDSETYGQKEEEEEIVWTIEGLQESLQNKSCHFRQVTYGSDCVGFAVWTLESSGDRATRRQKSKPTPLEKRESWIPAGLDVEAWNKVSMRLREERQRVLLDQQKIWSKSTSGPHARYISLILSIRAQYNIGGARASREWCRKYVSTLGLRYGGQ